MRSGFVWTLMALAVGGVALSTGAFVLATPAGMHWLGANIINTSDTALYLSLIHQVADGSWTSSQLYNAADGARSIFPFWMFVGGWARLGLSPLIAYELARLAGAAFLAWVVWFVASRHFPRERDARLAAILAFGGVGFGWLIAARLAATGGHLPYGEAILDLHSEFGLAPLLFGAGHLTVSAGLLILGLYLLWERLPRKDWREHVPYLACFGVLLSFHPYFIPTYVAYAFIACLWQRGWRDLFRPGLLFEHVLPLLPALALYAPLYLDPAFRQLETSANDLPLPGLGSLLISLAPFIAVFLWRKRQKLLPTRNEDWAIAWIIAVALTLLLPVPWQRKLLEGVGVAFVFLTMPAWMAIRDHLLRESIPGLTRALLSLLLVLGCADLVHLELSNLGWAVNGGKPNLFYASKDPFAAWDYLKAHTAPDAVIASNEIYIMMWTPAYADRHVWLGHAHGTTDYRTKRSDWNDLWTTPDRVRAEAVLGAAGVTHVITTTPAAALRMADLPDWNKVFVSGEDAVFARVAKVKK